MQSWTWDRHTYWSDLEQIFEIKSPNVKIEAQLEDTPTIKQLEKQQQLEKQHLRTELNYSMIVDESESIVSQDERDIQGEILDLTLSAVGSSLIGLGTTLLIPEGSEVVIPFTLADEALGIVLVGTGLILKFVDWS